jgi:hypothetical protein
MSFTTLKKDMLLQAAAEFGVDVEEDWTRPKLVVALQEDGVTWDMYKSSFPDLADIPDEAPAEPVDASVTSATESFKPKRGVLLRMTRENGTYEIRGYKFTKKDPFLPVDEDNANYILETIEGFRIASPREAEEFYS